jgi:hypothetical protein
MHLSSGLIAAFANELTKLGVAGAAGRLMPGVLQRVMPQLGGASKAMSTGARRAAGAVAAPAHRLSQAAGQQTQRLTQMGRQAARGAPAAPAAGAQASPLSGLFAGAGGGAAGRAPIAPSLRGMRAPAPSAGAPVSFAPNPQLARAFSGAA